MTNRGLLPEPWLADADVTLYHGDVLAVLRELPAESVDCCVTSPPYWGLRDYGTGAWEGGDGDCDHVPPMTRYSATSTLKNDGRPNPGANNYEKHTDTPYRDTCGKCGATRIDQQLGLEPTPEEYVTRMVEVFREVRRVLASHGTVWLNLGSSYLANPSGGLGGSTLSRGGKQTTDSRAAHAARRGARPNDTSYTAPLGSLDPDSACLDLCDGCAVDLWHRSVRSDQPPSESEQPASLISRGTAPAGCVPELPAVWQRDAPVSTIPESGQQPPALCWRCGIRSASVSLQAKPTSSPDAPASAHTEGHRIDTSSPVSDDHMKGTGAGGMAWLNYTSRLKPKDMVPIPWMVAMALQQDGWYLRADIIWAKPNPMPESVTDRPTKSHEYVFMLSKAPRYFFDQEAVRERYEGDPEYRYGRVGAYQNRAMNGAGDGTTPTSVRGPDGRHKTTVQGADGSIQHRDGERWPNGGRNIRSVWEIATQPYPEAHFATFPEELARRCIAAGCPEQVCRVCGKARERVVEREGESVAQRLAKATRNHQHMPRPDGGSLQHTGHELTPSGGKPVKTLGFTDCDHSDYRPGICLDPFMGSGTVAYVARKLGRHAIGIDLSAEYLALAARRLQQQSLFAEAAS